MHQFGPNIWIADGPEVDFYGFPYPTRMVVIKLTDGSAWIWSPIELQDDGLLAAEVEEKVGPVRHIVSPNKIHHLSLASWARRFPEARVYAPPGLEGRKCVEDVVFYGSLGDDADTTYRDDIDQVVFRGSCFMEEVAFFHGKSRTAILCDMVQRFPAEVRGWKGWMTRTDGIVGPVDGT